MPRLVQSPCLQEAAAQCQSARDETVHLRREIDEPMRPIGAWATGKCDWTPSAGLAGVRSVVDHYSITRFSVNEWTQRNHDVFDENQRRLLQSKKFASPPRSLLFLRFQSISLQTRGPLPEPPEPRQRHDRREPGKQHEALARPHPRRLPPAVGARAGDQRPDGGVQQPSRATHPTVQRVDRPEDARVDR